LRRHTTPAFSASLRKVAVATPPTPPVLHTAALGGSGPGWFGQLALDVHCAWVMLHLPTATQFALLVQLMLVRMLQAPGVGRHSVSLVQSMPVVLHLPTAAQFAVVRHAVLPSLQRPNLLGQVPGLAVHAAFGGLLQVPGVRHVGLLTLHARLFLAPAAVHLPRVAGH
jgi:hypothetical protein